MVGKALRHITLGSELSSKSRGETRYFLGMRRPRLAVSDRLTSGDKYEILGDLPNYRLKSRKKRRNSQVGGESWCEKPLDRELGSTSNLGHLSIVVRVLDSLSIGHRIDPRRGE